MKHLLLSLFTLIVLLSGCKSKSTETAQDAVDSCQVQFRADSAYNHIVAQCDFGPRTPGSEAHRLCGDWIVERFGALGLRVEEQKASLTMWDGSSFECRNIIAHYGPESATPIVICAHWDARPWADADPDETKHTQPVMAANDGASGVAVMLELARLLPQVCPDRAVDFVCFDLEDYGSDEHEGSFAMGAQHWASHNTTAYEWGILLDMVGGKDAQFRYEGFSMHYAPWLVARTWDAARTAGFAQFFPTQDGGFITDDHGPMNEAGIPTIDIIPYYQQAGVSSFGPTWHTTHDTPENISRETLRAVGQTLVQLLHQNDTSTK